MPEKNETFGADSLKQNKYGPKSTLAQSLATIAQSFLFVGLGMNIAIFPIVIRDLYSKTDGEFTITTSEASWYGSLLFITYPIGSFSSGYMQGRLGKKRCMIIANIPGLFGLIFLYFAYSWIFLYVSALLMGLSTGFGTGATTSYVGEISEPRLRGSLGSLGSMAQKMGSSSLFIMAYFFDWRTVALLSTLCPIICICLVLLIPESPIWLIAKGKNEKAEEALCWLRGWVELEIVKPEFLELVHYNAVSGTKYSTRRSNDQTVRDKGFRSKYSQFKDPSVYKPLKLMLIYFFISFISWISPTRPFITKIMQKADLFVSQNESLIILSIMNNLGSIICTSTIHLFGKRFLTLCTLSINTVLLFLFGMYIMAIKHGYLKSLPWLALTTLCGIYLMGSCGASCISWMLLIEVFPNKSRGIATSTCTGLAYLILFTLTKSYLSVEMMISLEYTMILFSCICFFGFIYLYFYLPETENKTLLEIEEFFASNKKGYQT